MVGIASPPDLQAVNDLVSTMKFTLTALSKTFETLGDQTSRVADLGPALQATHQVDTQLIVVMILALLLTRIPPRSASSVIN